MIILSRRACETFNFLPFIFPFGRKIPVLFYQLVLVKIEKVLVTRLLVTWSNLSGCSFTTLLVSYSLYLHFLFISKKNNILSMIMLGFLTLDCSFNGRFDLLDANGTPNASASSSTGKPGLHHGTPPCWLW